MPHRFWTVSGIEECILLASSDVLPCNRTERFTCFLLISMETNHWLENHLWNWWSEPLRMALVSYTDTVICGRYGVEWQYRSDQFCMFRITTSRRPLCVTESRKAFSMRMNSNEHWMRSISTHLFIYILLIDNNQLLWRLRFFCCFLKDKFLAMANTVGKLPKAREDALIFYTSQVAIQSNNSREQLKSVVIELVERQSHILLVHVYLWSPLCWLTS